MSKEFLDILKGDFKYIHGAEFSQELTVEPRGLEAVVINGMATVISRGYDSEGLPVIGENSHITFIEKDLNDLGIVTRGQDNRVDFKDWLVSFEDSSGITVTYRLAEPQPDKTTGVVYVQLERYKP